MDTVSCFGKTRIDRRVSVRLDRHRIILAGAVRCPAEEQRGPAYAAYLRSAAANPDIVGCHWFQYVDEPLTGRLLDGENGNMGFVTVTDTPYADLVSAAREANLALLKSLQ